MLRKVSDEERQQFISAVLAAKAGVYGMPDACPYKVSANIIDGISEPEFQIIIREPSLVRSEKLAEIISPHAPVCFIALKSMLEALELLRMGAEAKKKEEEDGDQLVGAGV